MTQSALARASQVNRLHIVRSEAGLYTPDFDQVLKLAGVLKVPLQRFISGESRPSNDLRGLAFELFDLGIRDLVVSGAVVPGAFRRPEEVVVLALAGDRPDPRVVDAMPFVLATRTLVNTLLVSFAGIHDPRVVTRLGWMSDVTISLAHAGRFPVPVRNAMGLAELVREARPRRPALEADSLGHSFGNSGTTRPLLWRRWNITYAGTPDGFIGRATELALYGSGDYGGHE